MLKFRGILRAYQTPFNHPVDSRQLRLIGVWQNKITDNGLKVIRALVSGAAGNPTIDGVTYDPDSLSQLQITTMRVTSTVSPPTPAASDTALGSGTGSSMPVTVTYDDTAFPPYLKTTFSAVLPAPSLTGLTLTEEGIFTAGGVLVARLLINPALVKTSVAVQFDHVMEMARSEDV